MIVEMYCDVNNLRYNVKLNFSSMSDYCQLKLDALGGLAELQIS